MLIPTAVLSSIPLVHFFVIPFYCPPRYRYFFNFAKAALLVMTSTLSFSKN